jgi:galactoside O-acetyltransferase
MLGANTVVLPGITIGEGAFVGAGSLVKSSLAPWGVYAGNPLRLVKMRPEHVMRRKARAVWRHYEDWQRDHGHLTWTQYLEMVHKSPSTHVAVEE